MKNQKELNKNEIAKRICRAALAYKEHLVGRSFLYVFEGRSIEVLFLRSNFLHLTGVGTSLSSRHFYDNAVRGKLRADQIEFSQRHPYDLCLKKISQLENLSLITNSDVFMTEGFETRTFTYRYGMTELTFTACLSEDMHSQEAGGTKQYFVRSLRTGDEFDRAAEAYEVYYIFSMRSDEHLYSNLLYMDDRHTLKGLTDEVKDKLDPNLLSKESSTSADPQSR